VLKWKAGPESKDFRPKLKQAETEAEEQRIRVVTKVRRSYIQALAAQQTLELRQNLSKLADNAVETSRQLANVGQADAPTCSNRKWKRSRQNSRSSWPNRISSGFGKHYPPLWEPSASLDEARRKPGGHTASQCR